MNKKNYFETVVQNQIGYEFRCYINEYGYYETVASSKKQAKKLAAYNMLMDVLDNYEEK